jgi:hypothetical protein
VLQETKRESFGDVECGARCLIRESFDRSSYFIAHSLGAVSNVVQITFPIYTSPFPMIGELASRSWAKSRWRIRSTDTCRIVRSQGTRTQGRYRQRVSQAA